MKKRLLALCMLSVLWAAPAAGCGDGDAPGLVSQITAKQVLKVDGQGCSLPEARVFLVNYQNLYGTVMGVDLWKAESQKKSLEEYVKDLTVSQLTKILSMDSLAKSREIALDEQETASVEQAAEAYYDSLGEAERSYLGVMESDVRNLYMNYALAQKLYESLTAEINSEVSDDEARIMQAMQIFVTKKDTAKQIKRELKDGADFASLANSYNEADEISIQFGRGELPKEVEKAAFALGDNEISDCIKTEDGYYFLQCIDKFNEELTDANKLKIVKQREKEAFGDVYDAYVKTISRRLNRRVWDEVRVEQSDEIATDSFFEVYQEYCGELF